jgi:predicted dehydrogenase
MEWQMRNWYYFTWLCGDFNVEQHVHHLDVCAWLMKDQYPVSAIGLGGRQVRTAPEYGNIYDHHSVIYEYANGVKLFSNCRQQPGCRNDMSIHAAGAKGTAELTERRLTIMTDDPWTYSGKKNEFYQTEHDELFASIRNGKPINNGGTWPRAHCLQPWDGWRFYTGQLITWEQALDSTEDLSPERYDWAAKPPPAIVAIPGVTKMT